MKNISDYAAVLALDWGEASHAFALRMQGSGKLRAGQLASAPESLHPWFEQLAAECANKPVLLVLEAGNNNLVAALCEHEFVKIHLLHPAQSASFRACLRPSRAKDDLGDARALLEFAEKHHERLRCFCRDSAAVRELALLVRTRRTLVDELTGRTNQLRAALKSYYPQALELAGRDLAAPMALAFLRAYPRLADAKKAGACALRAFYIKSQSRREGPLERRLRLVAQARELSGDEARTAAGALLAGALVEVIEALNKHISLCEQRIAELFAGHQKANLFAALPGAGPVMAPRLLALFGDNPGRYKDARALQCYAAVAPVREQSGARTVVHWRRAAPVFERQTLVEWAGQTVIYCRWAGEYYRRQKAAGKTRGMILRSLAFKWVPILWRCLEDNTAYDDERYEQSLIRRRSPLARPPA